MAGTQADDTSQTLAWAGLRLSMPEDYRPARLEGDHTKGLILLADDARARLLVAWATVTRKRFDADSFCTQKLLSLFDDKAGVSEASIRRVQNNRSFPVLFWAHSAEEEKIRAVGHCPQTGRVIDCLYHTGTARENLAFTQGLLGSVIDQPTDLDYQWAVLGSAFDVPGGFRYFESTLNLGDQTIRFIGGKGEGNGPVLAVRQVYPADLALGRGPIEEWLEDWGAGHGASYAPQTRRKGLRFPVVKEPVTLAGHEGFVMTSRLRLPLKLTHWWMARHARFYGVLHKGADRLLLIQASGPMPMLDGWAHTVAASLRLTGSV